MLVLVTGPSLTAQTAEPPATYRNIPLPRLSLTAVQARPRSKSDRERFEADFGIQDQRTTGWTAPIVRAKYAADLTLFTLDTFANTIEDAIELRYSHGKIHRAAGTLPDSMPVTRATGPLTLEDARLKFDLELAGSRPYLGIRFVIPLGN